MTLILEDGSQVANSDTYVTKADYIAYAASIGIELTNSHGTEQQLIKAAIFIGSKESMLIGCRVARDQSMAYPRTGLVIEGFTWNSNEIPRQLILAQMNLALDINAGIDLYNPPPSDAVGVKREKIDGAVEVEYAVKDSVKLSRNSTSRALMSSLMKYNGLTIPLVMA